MNRQFVYENVSFEYRLLLEPRQTLAATVFPTQAILAKARSKPLTSGSMTSCAGSSGGF